MHSPSKLRPSEATLRSKVAPALRRALASERCNDIVTGAPVALAKIGEQRGEDCAHHIAPALSRFLADPNEEISENAVIALGILASANAIGPLPDLALDLFLCAAA
jgi:HEAT repeat protein